MSDSGVVTTVEGEARDRIFRVGLRQDAGEGEREFLFEYNGALRRGGALGVDDC